MKPSDKTTILGKIELRDKEVYACFCHYLNILGEERLNTVQQLTSDYAKSKAQAFLSNNIEFFEKEENRTMFFQYACLNKANKPNSGKRFLEELYKIVSAYTKQKEEEKENI